MLSVKVFTFNPVAENTYILYNEQGEAIIIDPGCYTNDERNELKDFFTKNSLKPVQLINTHCHLDHVFGNKWVHETYGLELFIHPNEEMVLNFAPEAGKMWGLPFENYEGPIHFLHENEIIKTGLDALKILLTPGHSPGSICLFCESQNFVIGGDVLFRESIGRTDLPGGNHAALIESIKQQLMTLPDDVIVYSGHGGETTIGHERKHNPYLVV